MKRSFITALAMPILATIGHAGQPKVVAVKEFTGIYPASYSLRIPFHGCVALDGQALLGEGEHWLSLDHLIMDDDYGNIQVLVNSAGTILGARAIFKGSLEEWRDARGYASRQRILSPFMGGDGSELDRELPLAYDANGFGDMVYTFDGSGHVSWRLPQDARVIDEATYVTNQEKHKLECGRAECKNPHTAPVVVLPGKKPADKPSN